MKKAVPILEVQDNCVLKFYSILLKDGSLVRRDLMKPGSFPVVNAIFLT